jgi:tetratricopeptide (TPR) repeat protein
MEIKQKECIDDKVLLVICPTRGRVHKCKQMIKSFISKSSKDTGLLLMVDQDDPELPKYLGLFHDYAVSYTVNPRKTYIALMNEAAKELPGYKYYCPANDDFIFDTHGWDMTLMGIIDDQFQGIGIAHCNDGLQHGQVPVVAVISGEIVKALGYIFPTKLTHLYGDNALNVIGKALNRITYVSNVSVKHEHVAKDKKHEDDISKQTNSEERYRQDGIIFKEWEKRTAKDDIIRVAKAILPASAPTVTLCMIVKDTEKPKDLTRCLNSIAPWIDEVRVFVNYKGMPRPWAYKALQGAVRAFKTPSSVWYGKFEDFSSARNQSIAHAHSDFILWLDCDDVLQNPWVLKDWITRCPDVDGFRCPVDCFHNANTKEVIWHTRLFKNNVKTDPTGVIVPAYQFRNKAHEDIGFSMKEAGANVQDCNLTVYHLGYMDKKTVNAKNERNMALLMEDYDAGKAHSLTYYGLVNCHLLRYKKEDYRRALQLVDEYFDKFGEDKEDPLTPKMWSLRGGAAHDYWKCTNDPTAFIGAKQSFEKAWNGWKFPEAAVNLSECFMIEKKFDEALSLLTSLLNEKSVKAGKGLAVDMDTIRLLMNEKLGTCYLEKKEWDNAIVFLSEASRIKSSLSLGNGICFALRNKGDWDGAASLTLKLLNSYPHYADGWSNMASYEMQSGRRVTASIFLRECLKINPKHLEARHNLNMLLRAK